MLVTFPGVAEQFFVETGNQLFGRSPDSQLTVYKIDGDEFIKLVNSRNIVYLFAPGTLGMHDGDKWEDFAAKNLDYTITRTTIFYTKPRSPNTSYGIFTLYGFTCSGDAALFKLTWL